MHKISRIYVGNYGVPGAWYDGQVFDLRGPHATGATDTIINLENGGGKTTLLSFVLSCFEPAQHKWLSHLTSMHRRCHFHEYFPEDGRPATCAIEWEMPPRTAGGRPYNLVIAQVVSRHTQDTRPEVTRVFFSFETQRGLALGTELSFDTLPVPKISDDPAFTLQAYRKWIYEHRTKVDFFKTESHDAWLSHLKERNIDVDMLRLQVQFSATEGGIDQGFLRFRTEEDLLRKIFELALDERRAAAVRTVVVEACDRLSRKPALEQRAQLLAGLQGVLTTFSASAVDYLQEKEALDGVISEARSLAAGLLAQVASATRTAETAAEEAKGYEAMKTNSTAEMNKARTAALALERRSRILAFDAAVETHKAAQEAHKEAKHELRLIQATQLNMRNESHKAQVESLEEHVRQKTRELEPMRRELHLRAARLRYRLGIEAQNQREAAATAMAEHTTHQREVERLDGALRAVQTEIANLANRRGQLTAAQESCDKQRETLLADSVLQQDEGALAAAERHRKAAADSREAETTLQQEAGQLRERASTARSTATALRQEEARKDTLARQLAEYVAKGLAEKEALQQDSLVQTCTESGNADIESPLVAALIDKLVAAQERELMGTTITISQLGADQDAITKTGLSGLSPDVDRVVAALESIGVKSAAPYNKYIAEVAPDADRAREIVQSNPARFLGVHVSSGDFDLARGLQAAPPQLTKPVVISVAQIEADSPRPDCIAIMPADDSAFNYEAAMRRADTIAQQRRAEEDKEKNLRERLTAARAVRTRIQRYIDEYGSGRLSQADEQAQALQAEAHRLHAEASEMELDAASCEQNARAKDSEAREAATRAVTSANNERGAEQFWQLHEKEEPQRAREVAEITEKEQTAARRHNELKAEQHTAIRIRDEAQSRSDAHNRLAQQYAADQAGITEYDAQFDAAGDFTRDPQPVELLRENYSSQKRLYDADEKSRLAEVAIQLEHQRSEHKRLTQEYQRDFPDIESAQTAAKRGLNFEVAIPAAREAIDQADKKEDWATAERSSAHERLKQHEQEHPESLRAMLEGSDATLADSVAIATRINVLKERVRLCDEDIETAAREARRSQQVVNVSHNAARSADAAFRTLASPFDIQKPIAEPPAQFTEGEDPSDKVAALLKRHQALTKGAEQKYRKAANLFQKLRDHAKAPKFLEIEPEMATLLAANDFEASCLMHEQLLKAVADRQDAVHYSLQTMKQDFDACAGELNALCSEAIAILNAITTTKKLPADAPYVGGKAVLKMDARFASKSAQTRMDAIDRYLTGLIASGKIPEFGHDLVAAALIAIHGTPVNLQVLRMVPNPSQQYLPVDKIVNSGGEGVVMAIFLYIVIMMLRAEVQAKVKKAGGGPLILDNPFAKATSPKLWDACRKLAQAADLQLIFATALPDYNTLANFSHFVRLRRAGVNSKTGRMHLEIVDHTLKAVA